ncbi:hypothetical protein [Flavobacterium sp. JP2137]
MPMLKKNLTEKEFNQFIEIMEFDEKGNFYEMDYKKMEREINTIVSN